MTSRSKKEKSALARDASSGTSSVCDLTSPFHWRVGWWSLLVFVSLGIALETMHGFKVGWYLDVSAETRRLMWTLAHTHGTLLSLVHLAFAATCQLVPVKAGLQRKVASNCLLAASIMIPLGFFAGGLHIHEGDPGLGILLVPPGGILLLVAVLMAALSTSPTASR